MLSPHRGLSSWSLLEGDEHWGARSHYISGEIAALLVAEVSLDNTFVDVLVDDGYFAHHDVREAEVIVGTGDPRVPITLLPSECKVRVGGQEFGIEDRSKAEGVLAPGVGEGL